MKRKALFSVIIPLYNKADYILKTLSSIIYQSFEDYEVVIVDDGSTDDSVEKICLHFQDERIRIISQDNSGPAKARNTGVQNALSEWVVFMDADDYFLPNAFKTFHSLITTNPDIDYFITNYYFKSKDQCVLATQKRHHGVVRHPFYWEYLGFLSGRPGTELIRMSLMKQCLFNEQYRRYEDAECQYRIINKTETFQTDIPVMITDRDASEAASFRKNIEEDFLGHLEFQGKSFWEQMQLYKLALEAREGYGDEVGVRYKHVLGSFRYKITNKVMRFIYKKFLRHRPSVIPFCELVKNDVL